MDFKNNKLKSGFLLVLIFIFSTQFSFASSKCTNENRTFTGDTLPHDSVVVFVKDSIQQAQVYPVKNKDKLIAAILAFPVPFGMLGLHRIYLGTDPWVPVVYIITFGGGFGLLPLIDFIEIVTSNDQQLETYKHNKKIFMWVK